MATKRWGLAVVLMMASAGVAAQTPREVRPEGEPLSNTFVTAVESTVDAVDAVDLAAAPEQLTSQMQNVETVYGNLKAMTSTDREERALAEVNDLLFALRACRIQSTSGNDTAKCRTRLGQEEARVLDAIGKKKVEGRWVNLR
ncbi:hypothetical protein ACFQBQ_04840 [Granulicella cerasi]|uniref:UrcA family protein n=1 Tax=Granulicella cerasi TaxID=741063 RepID=A0ABW1Z770_9BACT|nr:hypothetical protein [Granulicella cerasi]